MPRFRLAFFLTASLLLALAPAQQRPVAGTWRISKGLLQNGSPYTGTVQITQLSPGFHKLAWRTSAGAYPGVAIQRGSVLFSGWGASEGSYGVVVYDLSGKARITGAWAHSQSQAASGTESFAAPAGGRLVGTHAISGTNPDGSRYTGSLTISEGKQGLFALRWSIGGKTHTGVGLRSGNLLAAGWSVGQASGIVEYTFAGNAARGRWATEGQAQLGTEDLAR